MVGEWSTVSNWKPAPGISVSQPKGDIVQVTGYAEINGRYVRQPKYDDIAGHPHYMQSEPNRRHLFMRFSSSSSSFCLKCDPSPHSEKDNTWRICKTCTEEEGALVVSETNDFRRRWMTMPPRVHERQITMKEVTYKERNAMYSRAGYADEEEQEKDEEKEEEDEYLLLERLFEKTVKWNESNHECLLFSNYNHVVSLLSMDPKKMKRQMHPNLLEFLQENKINVGESLDQLTARHHEILGGLTEVFFLFCFFIFFFLNFF